MPFVADASITLAWCLPGEATAFTDSLLHRLRTTSLVVPAIWPFEIANVLVVGQRRGRLEADEAAQCLRFLRSLPIDVEESGDLGALTSLVALAISHGLSAHDAAYLDVALTRGLPLATLDGQLQAAAHGAGVVLAT